MTEEAPDLKPCPFCGGPAVLHSYSDDIAWVACDSFICAAEGPTADTKADAAERWNARAVPA